MTQAELMLVNLIGRIELATIWLGLPGKAPQVALTMEERDFILARLRKSPVQAEIMSQSRAVIDQCQQIAGKALGYPWFKDDPKNFPDVTEANGVCIGEHVEETIVQELADAYLKLKAASRALPGEEVARAICCADGCENRGPNGMCIADEGYYFEEMNAVLALLSPPDNGWQPPKGWKLVPEEIDDTMREKMREIADGSLRGFQEFWSMILAVAAPPSQSREGELSMKSPEIMSHSAGWQPKTPEHAAYEFLKSYLNDDEVLVEGWRSKNDPRWTRAVKWFRDNAPPPIDIVFDGPPGPEAGRFVEVENAEGHSIRCGDWIKRPDGYWVLRIS